ncbi:MAG: TonB-dependent siderophore receptor [Paracoccus sp. (in: a-proteobacteria)]|uniref:TonB-dependent siderophore receptor n=1 Tax=Paracoccus sp. TaxID=267 RepID=UPI00391D5144
MTSAPVFVAAEQPTDQAGAILLPGITLHAEAASESGEALIAQTSRTGTKSATPLSRIPQAVSVVTRAQFEAQSADLVTEALRYTPGVLAESNGYDIRYDWYWIRGHDSFGYTWQDGLQLPGDPSSYAVPAIDPYALERVEVIKGPASGLYGQGVPGGLANLVSKRPQPEAMHEVFVEGSADGGAQLGGDVTGPLTRDGTLSYRLTGLVKNMGTQIDKERNRRLMLAPGLTWAPTDQTTLTGYGYFQKDEDSFSPRFYPAHGTLLPNPGGEIPRDLFLGDPSADDFDRDYAAIGYALEHHFDGAWTVRQNLRYARSKQDMFLVLVNPAFAFPGAFPGVPGPELNRVSAVADDELRSLAVDTQAEARFSTGTAQHTLLLGLDHGWVESSTNFGNSAPGVVPGLDMTDPRYGIDVVPPAVTRSGLQRRMQTGLYLQDQVEMGAWTGTAALRYDRSRIRSTNRMTNDATVTTRDEAVTGRVGLSYEFGSGISPYVSYSTSFLPLLGTDAQGRPFEASTSGMAEIGMKYVPEGTSSLITASLFSMTQDGFLTPDPLDPFSDVQGGKQRVRGLELEAKVAVSPQLDVIASYAYSASDILESTDATVIGNDMLRLPRHQGGLWMQYRDAGTAGLDLSLGLRGVSHYQTDADYRPDLRIPGYGLVDLGVIYDLGRALPQAEGVTLQLTASNVFDKRFVAQCLNITGGSCNYGEGRSVKARMSYAW